MAKWNIKTRNKQWSSNWKLQIEKQGHLKKKPVVNSDDLEGKEVSFWSSKTRKQHYFELYVKQNNACVY